MFFQTHQAIEHAVIHHAHIHQRLHLAVREGFDEIRALAYDVVACGVAEVRKALQIEGGVLLQGALPLRQRVQVVDQPHLQRQQAVQRTGIGYVHVQACGGRAQRTQGAEQGERRRNFMQQTRHQNGVEPHVRQGRLCGRMFEQRFDDPDASVIARQLARMSGKPGTGFDNGHLFESGIHREKRRHAAPHFQNASCLPGAQGGQYHPLAQFCLGWLEGRRQI